MRKLKLLFAACALLISAGSQAQKDVTNQYITNPTLSSLSGWTVNNFNNPVQGNNTAGYATEAYSGWNSFDPGTTPYYLKQTITLPAGHYTLVNYSFYREGEAYNTDANTSRAYLYAGTDQVAIKTLGSIEAASYANSQAEGANAFDSKMYRNTLDFTIDADNTEIEIGLTGTFEIMRSWCIAGMFELINNDLVATMDSPFDVTGYITNPGFEYRDMTGWTQSEAGYFKAHNGNQSFKVGGWFAEKYQGSGALPAGNMSQTLSGLPAGLYRLTANLGGDGTYIDLNGKTVNWTVDKDYAVSQVLSEGDDLVITAGKTTEGTANWIHFDDFKLLYCGTVEAALSGSLGKKTNYDGLIPSGAYTTLVSAVEAYNTTYADIDELLSAIDAIEALYTAADALKDPYAAWKTAKAAATDYNVEGINSVITAQSAIVEAATDAATITTAANLVAALDKAYASFLAVKANADALKAVANDNSDANSTFSTAISTQNTAATTAETADDINTATTTLKEAMATYCNTANPVGDGAKFDMTFMLTNPDLSVFKSDGPQAGWFTDQTFDTQNSQVMQSNNTVANSQDNSKFAMYEYWSDASCATTGYTVYTKINLPEGTYQMKALCMTGWGYNASQKNGMRNITFSAGDVDGTSIVTSTLETAQLDFVQTSAGEVKIGLKAHEGNTCNWMGIGYVQLFKVPAVTVTIDEDVAYTPESKAGQVTLKRTLSTEKWNTFVVPFQISNEELKAAFGAEVAVAEYSETPDGDNSTVNFTKMATPAIIANTPVLLMPASVDAGNTYVFENRTVATGDAQVAGTNFDFVGIYASATIGADNYFISANKLYKSAGSTTIQGTRAYIKAKDPGAHIANFYIDGIETTAIEGLEISNINSGKIYNLNGQEVKSAQKGIYIMNGKKVIK